MKLSISHPAQPSAATLASARIYLARDDAGLGSGACSMLGFDATTENYAALGRLVRAGAAALGEDTAIAEVVAMVRRRGRR